MARRSMLPAMVGPSRPPARSFGGLPVKYARERRRRGLPGGGLRHTMTAMPAHDGSAPGEGAGPRAVERDAAAGSPWSWGVAGATLALCGALALDAVPGLRGPLEWRWQLQAPLNLVAWRLAAPAVVGALIALWLRSAGRAARVGVARLGLLVALAVAFRFAVEFTGLRGVEVVGRTMNPAYQSYFSSAARVTDGDEFVRSYLARRDRLVFRELTHPPGNTLFYLAFVRAARHAGPLVRLASPAIAARRPGLVPWAATCSDADVVAAAAASVAIVTLGCLALVPLYLTAHRLGGPRPALLAAGLFAVMPAGALFMPLVDDVQTFLAATSAWLAVEGLARGRRGLLAASGLVLAAGTFLSYSVLPLGAFLALLLLLAPRERGSRPAAAALDGVAVAAGFAAWWLAVWGTAGLDPIRLCRVSLAGNYNAHARSYWTWLAGNPYDLLLFAGVPVAFHALAAVGAALRRAVRRVPLTFADALAAAFALALAALFVLGTLRGEAARTLLYVFPLMALLAAHDIARRPRLPAAAGAVAIALVAVQTVAFHAILRVYH